MRTEGLSILFDEPLVVLAAFGLPSVLVLLGGTSLGIVRARRRGDRALVRVRRSGALRADGLRGDLEPGTRSLR